jgi:hypothetical protein|tara:strand:+ start:1583 stop:1753 length:171 start_codon:yes stop_codon:yes gene_type:complete
MIWGIKEKNKKGFVKNERKNVIWFRDYQAAVEERKRMNEPYRKSRHAKFYVAEMKY